DDTDGFYGATTAKKVLGSYWSDPNRVCISVEIEGFAADGPNPAQMESLAQLGIYLQSKLPTLKGNLAHRDFQNYKACPGHKIPWNSIGGHGLYQMQTYTFDATAKDGTLTVSQTGHEYQRLKDATMHPIIPGTAWTNRYGFGP